MNIDATVVEIKPHDNIDQKYFLSFNIDYLKNFNDLENKNIFIYGDSISSWRAFKKIGRKDIIS
jgi:hypothetical protein